MRLRTVLIPVVLAAVAGGLPAPAAQAEHKALGQACAAAFATAPDAGTTTGVTRAGLVAGGPIVADDPAAWISISCIIQLGAADFGAVAPALRISFTFPGRLALGVASVEPTFALNQPIFVCTRVLWGDEAGNESAVTFDDDPTVPGEQCARTTPRAGVTAGVPLPLHDISRTPGARRVAIADIDGDGDDESFATDPTLRAGEARPRTPEVFSTFCDHLSEPDRTTCRLLHAACDTLVEPLRTECLDILRRMFFTTIGIGTGLSEIAELLNRDLDGDGEIEIVVTGTTDGPTNDFDFDGDVDIVWRA